MAPQLSSRFTGPGRRKSTIVIIFSALIPFTFCFVWLLSLSGAPLLGVHTHHHDEDEFAEPTSNLDDVETYTVKTPTGSYIGKVNYPYDNVHEFLNIPYALSTAGKNRFMPPVPVPESDETFDARELAMACPQFASASRSIWSEVIPWYRIPQGEIPKQGGSAEFTSEDCLSMAIWKPVNTTEESKLPVAMFWPGGGFQTNGISVPAHQAAQWVDRSESHLVVTINYRLSIMGFPGAAGVEDQNLGLLDQRLALEWVRDNIRHFGGDPAKIMVWGFSAGAQSVDFHNYAYYDDPIAHAHFAQSGGSLAFGSGHTEDHSKFTYVAKHVGCDNPNNSTKELECMQNVPYKEIINLIGRHSGEPRLHFGPITDERIVFSDYPARYESGKVTQRPMIYSSCSNDGSTLAGFDADHPERGPSQGTINGVTQRIMCGAAETSKLRYEHGLTTYRYQYAGDWPNQNPLDWLGAYHSSDLPMLFGTYADGYGPLPTPLESQTSEAMQDFLLAFMRDPRHGPASAGWPPYNPEAEDGGTMLRFGADAKHVQNATGTHVEGVCFGRGTYDPFP